MGFTPQQMVAVLARSGGHGRASVASLGYMDQTVSAATRLALVTHPPMSRHSVMRVALAGFAFLVGLVLLASWLGYFRHLYFRLSRAASRERRDAPVSDRAGGADEHRASREAASAS